MKLIGITSEKYIYDEADIIMAMLDCGLDEMHIRKPEYLSSDVACLLHKISKQYYSRIILHDYFELTKRFAVGGIHLNIRNPRSLSNYQGRIGRSCHSFEEVRASNDVDYCFLSPIFDSISKKGYHSHFSEDDILRAKCDGVINSQVYALGGITPDNLPLILQYGFGGAAFLGYLWQDPAITDVPKKINLLRSILAE